MIVNTSCGRCRCLVQVPATAFSVISTDSYCEDHSSDNLQDPLEVQFLAAVLASNESEADRLAETLDRAFRAQASSPGGSALAYARHGWPVFPVAVGGKMPAISKRDGGNGLKDATTNEQQIREWWGATDYNIGIATGHKFDVIDVDFKVPGTALRWADIKDTDVQIEAMVSTPHGIHAYVLPTGRGNTTNMDGLRGIDWRGMGGYVVAPPSVRADGTYHWWSKPSPRIL